MYFHFLSKIRQKLGIVTNTCCAPFSNNTVFFPKVIHFSLKEFPVGMLCPSSRCYLCIKMIMVYHLKRRKSDSKYMECAKKKLLKTVHVFLFWYGIGMPRSFAPSENQGAGIREYLLVGLILVHVDGERGSLDDGASLCKGTSVSPIFLLLIPMWDKGAVCVWWQCRIIWEEELQIIAAISSISNACSSAALSSYLAKGRGDVAFINHVGILMKAWMDLWNTEYIFWKLWVAVPLHIHTQMP